MSHMLSVLILVGLLMSCSKPAGNYDISRISSSSILSDSTLSDSEKSEAIAKQAEVLLTSQGFKQASEVVNEALKLDPENLRAKLIRHLLNPLMAQKGILVRFYPLMRKNPKLLKEYQEYVNSVLDKVPESSLKKFLLEGEEDVQTEEQFLAWLDAFSESLRQLSAFIKTIKDQEITIRANTNLIPDLMHRFALACEIITTASLEYELKCPPSSKKFDVTMDRADFEMIASFSAIYQANIYFYNSYDLSDAVKVSSVYLNDKRLSSEQKLEHFFRNSKFGKLRPQSKMKEIKPLLLELISALNWAVARQNTLCPKGNLDAKNRFGMLFNTGLCLPGFTVSFLNSYESILKGEPQEKILQKANGTSYKTKINYTALIENPISDLRSLLPIKFDACGNVEKINDNTLGGTYPARDANIAIPMENSVCSK